MTSTMPKGAGQPPSGYTVSVPVAASVMRRQASTAPSATETRLSRRLRCSSGPPWLASPPWSPMISRATAVNSGSNTGSTGR